MVVDTNFLMSSCALKIDVRGGLAELFGDFDLVVSRGVRRELEKLASGGGKSALDAEGAPASGRGKKKSGSEARCAIALLDELGARVVEDDGNVDKWIADYCPKNGAIACTNDRALVAALKRAGVRVACVKNRSKIDYC
ncbi:MAG: hypothetical protein NT157_00625 [Candidatus Micrarchaeota archaeon]|nr:hypothetical protein [Candidatus Micrarchaeota archaeon]